VATRKGLKRSVLFTALVAAGIILICKGMPVHLWRWLLMPLLGDNTSADRLVVADTGRSHGAAKQVSLPGETEADCVTLRISFFVLMRDEMLNGSSERCFAEQDQALQTRLFHRAYESLSVCV
jgi:hypothetical protein